MIQMLFTSPHVGLSQSVARGAAKGSNVYVVPAVACRCFPRHPCRCNYFFTFNHLSFNGQPVPTRSAAFFVMVLRTTVREVLMMNIPASHLAAEQEGWDYPGLNVTASNRQPSKHPNHVASSAARAVLQALASPTDGICSLLRLQVGLIVPLSDESGSGRTEPSAEWTSQPSDMSSSSVTAGAQGTPMLALRKCAWILRNLDL